MKHIIFLIILILLFIMLCLLSGCALFSTQSTPDVLTSRPAQQMWNAIARTNWFGTFCLLGFFGGVVAIGLDQRKIGSAVIIAAISTICLGLAIHRFPVWLAVIGFAGSVIAAGYSILIKNKVLKEIIRGVEDYRGSTIEHDELDGLLDMNQSKSTKKIVEQVKDKLNAHKDPQ